jgi:hypothetical protein
MQFVKEKKIERNERNEKLLSQVEPRFSGFSSVTWSDVERAADNLNYFLKNVNVKPGRRYGYTALDITDKEGHIKDTLIAGLTKREARDWMDAMAHLLRYEQNPY